MSDTESKQVSGKKRKAPDAAAVGMSSHKYQLSKGNANGVAPKAYSKEERKALKKARKAAKPHAELVSVVNDLFNQNLNGMEQKEREKLLSITLGKIRNNIPELCTKHDASRGLQLMIKNLNNLERDIFMEKLKGKFAEVSQNMYGMNVILKLLEFGRKEYPDMIVQELAGQIPKLALIRTSGRVIDYLYGVTARTEHRNKFLLHFYGREFYLFQSEAAAKTLSDIAAEKQDGAARLIRKVGDIIIKLVTKDMLPFRYTHGLIRAYLKVITPEIRQGLISELAPYTLAMHDTDEGAEIISVCFSYGSAKVRKTMVKLLKGRVLEFATHPSAYKIILSAMDVVDDSVLVNKVIVKEFFTDEGTLHPYLISETHASKILLQLLAPMSKKYLGPVDYALLQPTFIEVEGKQVPTSKKTPQARRDALFKPLLSKILDVFNNPADAMTFEERNVTLQKFSSPQQDQAAADQATDMDLEEDDADFVAPEDVVVDRTEMAFGTLHKIAKVNRTSQLLLETLVAASTAIKSDDTKLQALEGAYQTLLKSVVALGKADKTLFEDKYAHMLFSKLTQRLVSPDNVDFAKKLWNTMKDDLKVVLASNRACFVVAAVFDVTSQKNLKPYLKQLVDYKKVIQNNITAKFKAPGAQILLKYLDGKTGAEARVKTKVDSRAFKANRKAMRERGERYEYKPNRKKVL